MVLAGAATLAACGSEPSCIRDVCIGKKLPASAPILKDRTTLRPDQTKIRIVDLKWTDKVPLADVIRYRTGHSAPSGSSAVGDVRFQATLSDENVVQALRFYVAFPDGSFLWSPTQMLKVGPAINGIAGDMPPYQMANWRRVHISMRDDHLNDIRTVVHVWPGTSGQVSYRIDMGRTSFIERPSK